MLKAALLTFSCLAIFYSSSFGQSIEIRGIVSDENGLPLVGATVRLVDGVSAGSVTDGKGVFFLETTNTSKSFQVSYLGYQTQLVEIDNRIYFELTLIPENQELESVEITEHPIDEVSSVTTIDRKAAKALPSAFGDFNKILVTLPGVASNNELSSAYSVRGGNFDENLVYVNDIPVYRPFLSNAGRQEGLSFVNPELVQSIEFYAGGWEPKYGDKLSSSLNIGYKEPKKSEGAVTLGLLGGSAYAGGHTDRLSYLFGVRHRDSRYLLGTTEVEGQYFPTYTDFQSLLTFDLTRKGSPFLNKTKLNWLLAYGRNRYLTEPQSSSTEFGTFQQNFRLQTAFIGREILNYDTYQTGFRLTHRYSEKFRTHLIGSMAIATEKEQFDVEGGYRLCDVNTNPGSSSFDDCVVTRGIGTNYDYGRNELQADLLSAENRYELLIGDNRILEWGVGWTLQNIDDELNEYSFVDSADFISITSSTFNKLALKANQLHAYAQNTKVWKDSIHAVTIGVRATYRDENKQILVSPRALYRFSPKWQKPTTFKFSVGYYQQPPFYRELRSYSGEIQNNILAQSSIHLIGSMNRIFYMWDRPFLFNIDGYYKHLLNIIPYDIDNLRIRYYPEFSATGYARGVEFRVNGEFVKGTQSWFSLGFLQTRENLDQDNQGLIRRPMDQRINLAAFFEDHLPNDPSWRVYLNLVFGSGFPFGPPEDINLRGAFSGDEYYRADLGLSKSINVKITGFNKLWVRLELLNALAADNTLSYTWIEDVVGNNFAIPNSLSARFLNLKVSAEL